MTRATLWSTTIGDVPVNLAFTNNFAATVAPGVGSDASLNYSAGSVWIVPATKTIYTCTDATIGAAVWAVTSTNETTPGQIAAPAASTPTGAGSAASLTGGAGGATSGSGGASSNVGGPGTGGNAVGGAADTTGGAGHGTLAGGVGRVAGGVGGATGAGGKAQVVGGAGGATSGDGAAAEVTGGAAAAGNGNGGSVVLTGGAKNGTGIAGGVRVEGVLIRAQAAPTAKTVSATLTAAELLAGIVTINQGAGAPSAQQLPTGTAIEAALPADFAVGDSFDASFINTSTVDAEDASVTVNTDVTIVGSPDLPAHSGITLASSGTFRFRKTAAHAFVAYRIS